MINKIEQNKKILKGLTFEELQDEILQINEKKFRAKQLFEWMYNKFIDNFDDMTNLSIKQREKFSALFELKSINLVQREKSEITGTIKYHFETFDKRRIESVLIPMSETKATLCISNQIGCPLDCQFCATGKMGFIRNLTSAEIIDQYVYAAKDYGREKVTNIVYMGMGEPLVNFENTIRSLRIITSEYINAISRNRITVSTAGIPKKIIELADSGLRVKLALSLHSPFDEVRSQLMPVNKKYPLKTLIDSLNYYVDKTKTRITFEYTLFDGINDRNEDIIELAKILSKVPSKLNLIPFNSIEHTNPVGFAAKLKPTSKSKMDYFANKLREKNITVMIRETQGQDINAACGQLAALMKDMEEED